MKKNFFFCCFFTILLCNSSLAQQAVENNAFQAGEHLEYEVVYISAMGDIHAGKAIIDVEDLITDESQPGFRITGKGETTAFFDVIFKVRDKYESWIDAETLLPYRFIRSTREGNYAYDDDVRFDKKKNIATSSRTEIKIPANVHDIVSAVFFMRTLEVEDFLPDSTYYINFFLDDSVYYSAIRYEGKAFLDTKWGRLPCVKVKPMMATGEVFSRKYPMSVWITDDENHIPLLAESDVIVGKVQMRLDKFKGLKNPFVEPVPKKK